MPVAKKASKISSTSWKSPHQPERATESQEPVNIDETWDVTDDEFGDDGYDSVHMVVEPLDVALASFNHADAQRLSDAGATVADCNNIAELIRMSGGTLESVERARSI